MLPFQQFIRLGIVLALIVATGVTRPGNAATSRAPGVRFRDCGACPDMIVLPPGTFTVERKPPADGRKDDDPEGVAKSAPPHSAQIERAFAVAVYDVTRAQFRAFTRATGRKETAGCYTWRHNQWIEDPRRDWRNPGFPQTDRDPVVCVNWDDARAYVQWLNQQLSPSSAATPSASDGPYRLLTAEEVEYAAAANGTSPYYWGAQARRDQANYGAERCFPCAPAAQGADRWLYTSPVGSFPPNDYGLYDMAGNVWQWTASCYPLRNPPPEDKCRYGSIHGGSWLVNAEYLRTGEYAVLDRHNRNQETGFRVARTLD